MRVRSALWDPRVGLVPFACQRGIPTTMGLRPGFEGAGKRKNGLAVGTLHGRAGLGQDSPEFL